MEIIMKLFIYTLILSFFSIVIVNSAYLTNVPIQITQPDGTNVKCFASGDEYHNWIHNSEGKTIILNENTGYYVYAMKINNKLVPSEIIVGKETIDLNRIPKGLNISKEEMIEKARLMKRFEKTIKPQIKGFNKALANNIGTINNIVVFIRFQGEAEYQDVLTTYSTMFNQTFGNSMKNYFLEASYNQLTINSSFYPTSSGSTVVSYQDTHPRGYYQPYSTSNTIGYQGGDAGSERAGREHALLFSAIQAINNQVPANLNIDNDNDGYVDNVCFIISGSPNGWGSLLWPHRWSLYGVTSILRGKRVWDYNFQLQQTTLSWGNGVLCHEMFHTLGAPDLYHYNSDGINPVGSWDLMENTTNPPQHMSAFMKWKYAGWLDSIPRIYTSGTYSLKSIVNDSNCAYKVVTPNSTTEYFVLEYRNKTGTFENSLPGTGLLIYRINTNVGDGNADGPPDEVYLYRYSGTSTSNGDLTKAFFSLESGRTEFNDATNPRCFLTNNTSGGLNVSNIGASGNSISFTINLGSNGKPDLLSPINNATNLSLKPNFVWQAFTGAESYQIQVSTDQNFATTAIDVADISATSYTPTSNLSYSKTYYWRVRAKVSGNFTSWSSSFGFQTVSAIIFDRTEGSLCSKNVIKIYYTTYAPFNPGNTFIAQLSDTLGSFANARDIGSVVSQQTGTISCRIPDSIPSSANYRMRIISMNPIIYSDPSAPMKIFGPLQPFIGNYSDNTCENSYFTYYTTPMQGVEYHWKVKGGFIDGRFDSTSVLVRWGDVGQGVIYLYQQTASGCIDSTVKLIKINTYPTPQIIGGDSVVCLGEKIVYISNQTTKVTNYWRADGASLVKNIAVDKVQYRWDSLGLQRITLIQKNQSGCIDSVYLNVRVVPNNFPKISGENTACQSGISKFSVVKEAKSAYKWIVDGGTLISSIDADTAIVKWKYVDTAKIIIQKVNVETACDTYDTLIVLLNIVPEANISGQKNICANTDGIYFTKNIENSINIWEVKNGEISQQINSDSIFVKWYDQSKGYITLKRKYNNSCIDSITLEVNINPQPQKPSITKVDNKLQSSWLYFNQWYYEGNILNGETKNYIIPSKEGKYTVKARSDIGCFSVNSDEYLYDDVSVYENINNGLNIIPNPAKDNIKVILPDNYSFPATLYVLDISGREILNIQIENREQIVDVNSISSGTYQIVINNNQSSLYQRFTVIK